MQSESWKHVGILFSSIMFTKNLYAYAGQQCFIFWTRVLNTMKEDEQIFVSLILGIVTVSTSPGLPDTVAQTMI